MGKFDQVLPYLWVMKSSVPSDDNLSNVELIGGGLCIHPTGILVSVTHSVKPDCPVFNDAPSVTITAKRRKDTELRGVDIIENTVYQDYCLSLFRVRKLNDNEVFDAFPVPDSIAFKMGSEIFAFVYQMGPFGGAFGYLCQSYESDPSFHVPGGARTVGSVVTDTHRQKICDNVSWSSVICDAVGKQAFYESLRGLNPSLPLIQVQDFHKTTLDGQCGWPVFTKGSNELVGLIAFSTGFFQWLIPAHFLRQLLDRNLGVLGLDEIHARPPSEVA